MVRGVIIGRWLDPQILTSSSLSHFPLSVGADRRSRFQSVTEFTNERLQRTKTQVGGRGEDGGKKNETKSLKNIYIYPLKVTSYC